MGRAGSISPLCCFVANAKMICVFFAARGSVRSADRVDLNPDAPETPHSRSSYFHRLHCCYRPSKSAFCGRILHIVLFATRNCSHREVKLKILTLKKTFLRDFHVLRHHFLSLFLFSSLSFYKFCQCIGPQPFPFQEQLFFCSSLKNRAKNKVSG